MKVALPRAYEKTVLEYCRMRGAFIHISVLTFSTMSAICFVLMKGIYAIVPLGEQERIVPKAKERRLDFEGFNTVERKIIWRKDLELSMNAKNFLKSLPTSHKKTLLENFQYITVLYKYSIDK